MEKIMTRTARIGFAAVLLLGGATRAMAQNGPPTGGYGYGYHHHHYGYHHRHHGYYRY
jgi:hypothetical protein